jgi:nucleotide-binding universal stress UspA family protein
MDALKPALQRIVVGMDFGAPSVDAARWVAGTFAPGAELVLTQAVGARAADDESAVRQRMHDVAGSLAAPANYRVEVRAEGAARAILEVAMEVGADLIVVGPHGGRETPRGIGTTAERLIRTSPVPVLLVAHARRRRLEQLLVPVDGGDLTPRILEWSDFLARRDRAAVTLMHVGEPRSEATRVASTGRESDWLTNLVAESPDPRVTTSVTVEGKPAEEILLAAARAGADLVVMGRRGQRRALSGIAGSTASDVLRRAPCPILIVVDRPDAMFDEWPTT